MSWRFSVFLAAFTLLGPRSSWRISVADGFSDLQLARPGEENSAALTRSLTQSRGSVKQSTKDMAAAVAAGFLKAQQQRKARKETWSSSSVGSPAPAAPAAPAAAKDSGVHPKVEAAGKAIGEAAKHAEETFNKAVAQVSGNLTEVESLMNNVDYWAVRTPQLKGALETYAGSYFENMHQFGAILTPPPPPPPPPAAPEKKLF